MTITPEHTFGASLGIPWTIPFAGILLSIALFPLFAPRWWHHHYPHVSILWALALAVPFAARFRGVAAHEMAHMMVADYLPFIVLLWALYTVASGILVTGTLKGTPGQNVLMLLSGAVLASWIGTTGASIVLIRPLLRALSWRKRRAHVVVFFIFMVSNIGGALTPLGDPPLFLGFLHGVPFFWTLNLLGPVLFLTVPLLAVFYFIDRMHFRHEEKVDHGTIEPVGIRGSHNFVLLAGIVGAVFMSGVWKPEALHAFGVEVKREALLRDGLLIALGVLSLKTTSRSIHAANQFSWGPIREVAILFAGIFVTIIPAIAILKAGPDGSLRSLVALADSPRSYFWLTGGLSSFLDNAPTYLTFFNTALGSLMPNLSEAQAVPQLIGAHHAYLSAISCGAVFMGANTYVGNAPNFMVKSIAEEAGIRMPSFFGYMFRYSIPFLIPLFLIATFVFFA